MVKALVRDNSRVLKMALAGTTLVALALLWSMSRAAADEIETSASVAPASEAREFKAGFGTMAPIPDRDERVATSNEIATDGVDAQTQSEEHCLATAIYFEARGESRKGQKAVAEVIVARTHVPGRPKTICGVVYEGSQRRSGCQFSFTCDRSPDVPHNAAQWARAGRIAETVISTRGKGRSVARGATFYHADYVKPAWASGMVKVAQIGSHIFYRPRRGRLS